MESILSDQLTGSLLRSRYRRMWCSRKVQAMCLGKELGNSMCHQRCGYFGGEFSMNFCRQKQYYISAMLSLQRSVKCVVQTANQSGIFSLNVR